jgi:hypothetical protein
MEQDPDTRWYVRDRVAGQPRQVWLFDDRTATRFGITNPETGAGTYFKAEPGETIWDCIRRLTPWLEPDVKEGLFYPMACGPGEYYPRIARPLALGVRDDLWSPWMETDFAYVANSRNQQTLLVRKLESICHTVQPTAKTLDVYGHEIRNLLILAATEVEMYCRGILTKNGSSATTFNSNEYVKLADPLKLRDYAVTFGDFPDIQAIRPFAGWVRTDPSKSLGWYGAYNGVKHNRKGEFDRATLRHAFEAVSACVALFVAQFGPAALSAELSSFVRLEVPAWSIGEMYLSKITSADRVSVNCPGL